MDCSRRVLQPPADSSTSGQNSASQPLNSRGLDESLIALRERDVYMAQLLFAARHLAESRVLLASPAMCFECMSTIPADALGLGHREFCSVGRVLRLLEALQQLPPNPSSERSLHTGKPFEPAGVVPASTEAPAESFFEPWQLIPETDSHYAEISDSQNEVLFDMSGSCIVDDGCERYARRIVACVNACTGMPTEELEKLERGVQQLERIAKDAAERQIAPAAGSSLDGGAQ